MRPLRWVHTIALALAVSAFAGAQGAASGNALPMLDVSVEDTPSAPENALLALDGEPLPILDVGGAEDESTNSTISAIVQNVMLALDTIPSGVAACNRGRGEISVLFGISVCFSDAEIGDILTLLNQNIVTASENLFYFNDMAIKRTFSYGGYKDGSCPTTGRDKIEHIFENLKPSDNLKKKHDLYVNIGKDRGVTFTSSLTSNRFDVDHTLDIRVCAGSSCPSGSYTAASSVPDLATTADEVTAAMYCGDFTGASPFTYTSDQRKQQCGCKCPGAKVPKNGCCECPGELVEDSNGVCGCTGGREATADNKCVCTGGKVFTNGACACPAGTHASGNVCVRDCFWKASNEGFSCLWQDHTKQSLKLKQDCNVFAPVPKDNYVADKRNNKYDESVPDAPSADPMITISALKKGASSGVSKATSWLDYALAPGNLEDQVQLGSFGVFDLKMKATDYRYDATCVGCIAIVDDFPPTPKEPCSTDDLRTSSKDYSATELTNAIAAEDSFKAFYSASNVLNNGAETTEGDNKRTDVKSTEMKNFFATIKTTVADLDGTCFSNNYVKDLLEAAKNGLSELKTTVDSGKASTLSCERCCFKSIVLKEKYRKYECYKDNWAWDEHGASTCSFGRCLKMPPKTLVKGDSWITDAAKAKTDEVVAALPAGTTVDMEPNVIHRSFTCDAFGKGCKVQPRLDALFGKKAEWATTVPTGYDVNNYVYWRYKAGSGGTFKDWNDADILTFTEPVTTIDVQAYTMCGQVYEFTYKMKLHPHSTRDVCNNFGMRWVDNSPLPHKVDDNVCTYPNSDFALLTFNYDSLDNVNHQADTVKGKYTDVKCYVTVAEEGALGSTTAKQLPLSWTEEHIVLSKQFALEQVHNPTTAKNTDVKLRCEFQFKYFDEATLPPVEPCEYTLRITDCDRPTIETYSNDVVCLPNECGAPNGPPGVFETCGGDVFTTVVEGTTIKTDIKSVSGSCCTGCNQKLACTALAQSATTNGVKRCEPKSRASLFMALAMEEAETVAHAVSLESASASKTALMTALAGASALVAVVALVVVKVRASAARAKQSLDDAYVSLLD